MVANILKETPSIPCGDSLEDTFAMQDVIKEYGDRVNMPVTNYYAPGIYMRKLFIPSGTLVVGKMHKTEHLNIIVSGKCAVRSEGTFTILKGGDIFVSHPGIKKVVYTIEDTVWLTPHATDTTDLKELEKELIIPECDLRDDDGNLLQTESILLLEN